MSRINPRWACALALLSLSPLTQAQYKVVERDGRITYTDRPPIASTAKVQPMRGGGVENPTPLDSLPYELRQPAARFPVTLYTAPGCSTCDLARGFLKQRGIPFSEKTIVSKADAQALEELGLGSEVPLVRIGQQIRRGFTLDIWATDLDLAGYPATSKLPSGFAGWEVGPLAGARTAPAPAPSARSEAPAALPPALETAPNGIRF